MRISDWSSDVCSSDLGKERWRFDPKVDPTGASAVTTCRGVAFHRVPDATDCPTRIITATFDARLIALDAKTGSPCASFGNAGFVDLKNGMGIVEKDRKSTRLTSSH